MITENENRFFREIVHQSVEERKKHGIERYDMIHLLTSFRDGKLDAIGEKYDLQDAGFATTAEFITADCLRFCLCVRKVAVRANSLCYGGSSKFL